MNPFETLQVESCPVAEVREFIERHHYSHSIAGVTPNYCFKVLLDGQLIGAAIFGLPGMRETLAKYSESGKYTLVELRRFVMVDSTPRNSESKSIAIMLRALRKQGIQRVLSYADPAHGHRGIIYKALGFTPLGRTTANSLIVYKNHLVKRSSADRYRRYRRRNLQRYNHQSKELGLTPIAQELRTALASGDAVRVKEAGKFVYLKDLNPPKPHRRPIRLSVRVNLLHGHGRVAQPVAA